MNPLLNNNNINNTKAKEVKDIISSIRNIQNPQDIINRNPEIKAILDMYQGNARSAFYDLCRKKGIDPNIILSQLK